MLLVLRLTLRILQKRFLTQEMLTMLWQMHAVPLIGKSNGNTLIDPETAKAIRDSRAPEHEDSCSMCGKFCAIRSMNKALNGEYIDIL